MTSHHGAPQTACMFDCNAGGCDRWRRDVESLLSDLEVDIGARLSEFRCKVIEIASGSSIADPSDPSAIEASASSSALRAKFSRSRSEPSFATSRSSSDLVSLGRKAQQDGVAQNWSNPSQVQNADRGVVRPRGLTERQAAFLSGKKRSPFAQATSTFFGTSGVECKCQDVRAVDNSRNHIVVGIVDPWVSRPSVLVKARAWDFRWCC